MYSQLISFNLPAAIEDLSGLSVPPSLLSKAATVRQYGGIEYISRLNTELPQLLQRNRELLDQACLVVVVVVVVVIVGAVIVVAAAAAAATTTTTTTTMGKFLAPTSITGVCMLFSNATCSANFIWAFWFRNFAFQS